jgi:hypothetical protein
MSATTKCKRQHRSRGKGETSELDVIEAAKAKRNAMSTVVGPDSTFAEREAVGLVMAEEVVRRAARDRKK